MRCCGSWLRPAGINPVARWKWRHWLSLSTSIARTICGSAPLSDFIAWPSVMVWLLVLAVVWILGRLFKTTRSWRIGASLLLLPILFLLAFEGGWWLIPADLAWLAIELVDRSRAAA